jgi:large subunit ribosomal protein L23
MALFGSKKKTEEVKEEVVKPLRQAQGKKPAVKKPVAKAPAKTQTKSATGTFAHVLVQPRITEKATMQAENGVYVFEVATDATKKEIGSAVKHYYNVTPVRVNIVKIPSKKVSSRTTRKKGVKAGGKKAYVFLKEGDKIEIV